MSGKIFLDTNIFVYLFSNQDLRKKEISQQLLIKGKEDAVFVVSTQVLQELSVVLLKKLQLDPREVKAIINDVSRFEVIQITPDIIQNALDHHIIYNHSFWDSLIITAAQQANCSALFTEDLNDGETIHALHIKDPYK